MHQSERSEKQASLPRKRKKDKTLNKPESAERRKWQEKRRPKNKCYPGPMRGMSWCSDSVERYLFSSSTRCLCVLAPPSRLRRSSSWEVWWLVRFSLLGGTAGLSVSRACVAELRMRERVCGVFCVEGLDWTYSSALDPFVSALRFGFACACARARSFTWCRVAVGGCG